MYDKKRAQWRPVQPVVCTLLDYYSGVIINCHATTPLERGDADGYTSADIAATMVGALQPELALPACCSSGSRRGRTTRALSWRPVRCSTTWLISSMPCRRGRHRWSITMGRRTMY